VADSPGEYVGTGYVINFVDYVNDTVTPYTMVLFGDYNGDGEIDSKDISECMNLLNSPPPSLTDKALAMSFSTTNPDILLAAPTMDTINAMRRYINGTDPIYFGAVAINRFEAVLQAAGAEGAPEPMPAQALRSEDIKEDIADSPNHRAVSFMTRMTRMMSFLKALLFWMR